MADLSTIFSWFETGDVPTEQQFKETFSSFYHKENKIPFLQVQGLTEAFENVASADSIDTITTDLGTRAKSDASNLSPDQIISWKEALEIVNIAVVDSAVDVSDGNVYNKTQIDELITTLHNRDDTNADLIEQIKHTLASDDINLDEWQEVVNFIKQNREDIEALQAVVIGATTDDKITLTGNYPDWGVTMQNQFNDVVYEKLYHLDGENEAVLSGNSTINHGLETQDLIWGAYDTVTGYDVFLRFKRVDNNTVEIAFDDQPLNPVKIKIRKL